MSGLVFGDGLVARAVAEALSARGIEVRSELRGEPLDALFIGRAEPAPSAPLCELDPRAVARAVEEGLTERFLLLSEALPLLQASAGRAVVEVSAAAYAVAPGGAAEAGISAALIGLARAAALEYAADRVRINVLMTAELPARWPVGVTAAGAALLTLALLDPAAHGVTGAVVACDGGVTAVAQLPAEVPDAPV
jgi:NAD(P)-dependent dehydrogenase (short-subunit alcohol dehydrogenase family)